MKKKIERQIEIPEGFKVEISHGSFSVNANGKEIRKKIPTSQKIKIVKKDNLVDITCDQGTKRECAIAGTIEAHIKNAIAGLKNPYIYKLEICNVHFPMTVKVDGKKLIIKNFLGEKVDRVAEILSDVEVKVKGNTIEVSSSDKDAAGQTFANIELATNVRNRDRRVFQDGIFLTEKGGEKI